jgi:putative ABC transport system substrate-binding protein
MRKGIIRIALSAVLFALCPSAEAQQSTKVAQIGFLVGGRPSAVSERLEALRQALREFGYVEGKNIVIEARYAEGNVNSRRTFAAELARLKVDVIVTAGSQSTRSAKEATSTIPIIVAQDADPVGAGFVASLARPGGNITGLSTLSVELGGKRLELLQEIVPKLSRVTVIGNSREPANMQLLKETELAAEVSRVKIHYLDIRGAKDIETGFRDATKVRTDAVLVLPASVFFSHRIQIAELAVKSRLPSIYNSREYVEDGGLMSYGVSTTDLFRRAATYVDKILKGTNPADLPVEQPTKFEMVINLKTAKQIGLTIPPNVLARADRVNR